MKRCSDRYDGWLREAPALALVGVPRSTVSDFDRQQLFARPKARAYTLADVLAVRVITLVRDHLAADELLGVARALRETDVAGELARRAVGCLRGEPVNDLPDPLDSDGRVVVALVPREGRAALVNDFAELGEFTWNNDAPAPVIALSVARPLGQVVRGFNQRALMEPIPQQPARGRPRKAPVVRLVG